jgi:hypothetical protein
MFTSDKIVQAMRQQPFRPFMLRLVDGRTYTVKHPEYIAISPGRRPREITFYTAGDGSDDYGTHWIDLGLVSEVIIPSGSVTAAPPVQGDGG